MSLPPAELRADIEMDDIRERRKLPLSFYDSIEQFEADEVALRMEDDMIADSTWPRRSSVGLVD